MKTKLLKDKVIYIFGTGARKVNFLPRLIREFTSDGARTYTMFSSMGGKIADINNFKIPGNTLVRGYSKNRNSIPIEDLILITPCTFNTLNKIAEGIADSYPLTVVANAIGAKRKVIIALSMSRALLNHPRIIQSIKTLQEWGCYIIYPEVLPDRQTMSPLAKISDSVYHSLVGPRYEHERIETNKEYDNIVERYYPSFKDIGMKIQRSGLTIGSGGCISQKIDEGVLVTANQAEIGNLKPDEISLVTSVVDEKIYWQGSRMPSSETPMFCKLHSLAGKNGSIIHGHCCKMTYSDILAPHITSDYIRYGDVANSEKIIKKLKEGDGFAILKLHGQITMGDNLKKCLDKLKTRLKEVEQA